jgi:hypothetical protein
MNDLRTNCAPERPMMNPPAKICLRLGLTGEKPSIFDLSSKFPFGTDFVLRQSVIVTVTMMSDKKVILFMERGWFPRAVSSDRRSIGRHHGPGFRGLIFK